ncbi:hypothetical protein OM999_03005 [Mycoplasmopsis cynos]|nr:hypothetical protein OM999_03005 [Mycoplasmopsis cynos]
MGWSLRGANDSFSLLTSSNVIIFLSSSEDISFPTKGINSV